MLYFWHRVFPYHDPIVVALMYHSVSNAGGEFTVPPKHFSKQIGYLKNQQFHFLTIQELLEWYRGERTLPKKSVLITFDDGYKDFMENALPVLNKYSASAVMFVHANRLSEPLQNNIPLMSWEDIREAKARGIEIGDHSFSHPSLKTLNREELLQEIELAQRAFQEHLSFQPEAFAYPGGKFNQEVIDVLKEKNYTIAFSIDRGLIRTSDDMFRLKRFGLSRNTSWLEFKARLTPVSDWYEFLVKF